ncbi:MBL fold metallo-hydrolase [Sphingomonas sp.]|uniref:MBL fold metallo-hydrolase n=1 Tax=Sphingomonas sp. TaxID=28214 RepID=UPI001EC85BE4|nr:MBL fold metallo-hydrolase [Sphingomonas sp.]MBX3592856.1 MBL fold metallo-hydrolase [Sphingomonas sp.]
MKHLILPFALLGALLSPPVSAQDKPAAPLDAHWVTLGTSGGPSVQIERAQISNALVVGDAIYVFDAGNDVQRQMAKAGLAERNVKAVFLSHHHLDHNADLGPIIVTHWLFGRGVLPVYGPDGTKTLVQGLVAANAPTVLASFPTIGPAKPALGDTVSATDLARDMTDPVPIYQDERIKVTAITVNHYELPPSVPMAALPQAVAYRVEAGGKSWVFSGDTGPSAGLEKLAKGADTLIVEVVDLDAIGQTLSRVPGMPDAVRQNLVTGMAVNHLPAIEIGKLAKRAGVGRVVLTHFVPSPEAIDNPMRIVEAIHRNYNGPVTMASDLERF